MLLPFLCSQPSSYSPLLPGYKPESSQWFTGHPPSFPHLGIIASAVPRVECSSSCLLPPLHQISSDFTFSEKRILTHFSTPAILIPFILLIPFFPLYLVLIPYGITHLFIYCLPFISFF